MSIAIDRLLESCGVSRWRATVRRPPCRSAPRCGTPLRTAEPLEARRMLAADIRLVDGVLTVEFDDEADDSVAVSITATGYEAIGGTPSSGLGEITRLVVTDTGTARTSSFTLVQADRTLTGGLSIDANVSTASINTSVNTNGGAIHLAAPTTLSAITLASGSGGQTFSGPVTLAGDVTLTATDGGNVTVSGGVTTAPDQTAGLSINAGTAGAVTFSAAASTIAGNVSVTARNILITADLVSTSGDILLVGDAGSTVAGAFHGVHVNGSGVEVKTLATDLIDGATGSITVFGRGGDAVAARSSHSWAYGVYVQAGAAIAAGRSGRVDVVGRGGVSTASARSGGVFISSSNALAGVSEIRSADGDIFVTGTAGGAPLSSDNVGVQVNNFGRIAAGGTGSVRVTGTGTLTGGGGSSGVVVVNNEASQADPTAAITSAGSSVVISGSGADGAAAVAVLNEGKVSSGGTDAVTIFADSLTLGTDSGIGAGTITAGAAGDSTLQIVPLTAGTRIDLGGEDVRTGPTRTLGLSVAEIGRLNAADLFVGDQTLAGPVIVSQPLAAASVAALTILTDAGLTLAADVTTTAGQYYAADVTLDRDVRLASEARTLDLAEIGGHATTGLARGVATSADGGIVYVASGTSGLVILDVSNPAAPTLLGSVATPGGAQDVALSADGTTAYVATGVSGLRVVDVSDPRNPALRGSVATGDFAANVAAVPGGSYVAVTSSLGGLFLVDVLDPDDPADAGSYSSTLAGSAGVAVSADGLRAYLCDFNGLVVMDISDPASPLPTGTLDLGLAGVAADVAVSPFGNIAYVTDTRGQLWIVDVTDPTTPAAINTFAPAGAGGYLGLEVSADGETVFVTTFENGGIGTNGLVAVNVSDPTAPAILDTLSLAAPAFTLALGPGGAVAYVADGSGGLRVVDCFTETPSNGVLTFTGTVDGAASGLAGLSVATTTTIDFQAALGGVRPLASLATTGGAIRLQAADNAVAGTFLVPAGTITGSASLGSLALAAGSQRIVNVTDTAAGSGYDQFVVGTAGDVSLDGAVLTVTASTAVDAGTVLTLVDNRGSAPVTGRFAGLPERAFVRAGENLFTISYAGGDGNDVTLTATGADVAVTVIDDVVTIALAARGVTITNLSTQFNRRAGTLLIRLTGAGLIEGIGPGVAIPAGTGAVRVNLARVPGFAGLVVRGGPGTDRITVGRQGVDFAAVRRGGPNQAITIDTGDGAADLVTTAGPLSTKGGGGLTLTTSGTGEGAGLRIGGQLRSPGGSVTLAGPTTLRTDTRLVAGSGVTFIGTLDGARRLTISTAGAVRFLADVGGTTPLIGVTLARASAVTIQRGFSLDGTRAGRRASGLTIARRVNNVVFTALGAAPVTARTIQGFAGSGVVFQGGSTGSVLAGLNLLRNGVGISAAAGSYAGSVIRGTSIEASRRIGIALSSARGLLVGGTEENAGNRIVAATAVSATGIRATGTLTGTRLEGNTIRDNAGSGVVLQAARGLSVGGAAAGAGNIVAANRGFGLLASGTCTGSVVEGNALQDNARGALDVRRARRLTVIQAQG